MPKVCWPLNQIIFPLKDWSISSSSFDEEEKIEERENGEENHFIDTNSQDSYKEKEEADEESGEEKSVKE